MNKIRQHAALSPQERQKRLIHIARSDTHFYDSDLTALLTFPSENTWITHFNWPLDTDGNSFTNFNSILTRVGNTLLHYAAYYVNEKLIKFCFSKDFLITQTNHYGQTPLVGVLQSERAFQKDSFLKLLRLFEECFYAVDHQGKTLLHHAIASCALYQERGLYYARHILKHVSNQDKAFLEMFLFAQDVQGWSVLDDEYVLGNLLVADLLSEHL